MAGGVQHDVGKVDFDLGCGQNFCSILTKCWVDDYICYLDYDERRVRSLADLPHMTVSVDLGDWEEGKG
jgi:hypothetical protein